MCGRDDAKSRVGDKQWNAVCGLHCDRKRRVTRQHDVGFGQRVVDREFTSHHSRAPMDLLEPTERMVGNAERRRWLVPPVRRVRHPPECPGSRREQMRCDAFERHTDECRAKRCLAPFEAVVRRRRYHALVSAIIGLGIDATDIPRIAATIERYGERFIQRIFTDGEIAYCMKRRHPAIHFAGRFAAKEAAMKALGTGHTQNVLWRGVEVVRHGGPPRLEFHGGARRRFDAMGAGNSLLTITHSDALAIAQVMLFAR